MIHIGDCRDVMRKLIAEGVRVDAIVTDPPYHLTAVSRGGHARTNNPESPHGRHRIGDKGFMGKQWDGGGVAFDPETWAIALDILKPGGHLLAFSGTRTYHRMTCAIEDAGFEIRDQIGWTYGTGFPKSKNLDGDWRGWGTALKPAWEPICVARKPLDRSVAENMQAHGTGAINVDGCRVLALGEERAPITGRGAIPARNADAEARAPGVVVQPHDLGRWPANLVHDGSDEVVALFPQEAGAAAPVFKRNGDKFRNTYGAFSGDVDELGSTFRGDSGSAARFFYCAKATAAERGDSKHPTIKPLALMRWLVRLVVPRGAIVLDPFAGSGSTVEACMVEQMRFIAIEREPEYAADIEARIARVRGTLGLELTA